MTNLMEAAPLSTVLRSWEDRFGAMLVGLEFDIATLIVTRPPQTEQDALLKAAAKLGSDLSGSASAAGAGGSPAAADALSTGLGAAVTPIPVTTVGPSPAKSTNPSGSDSPSAEPSSEPTPMVAIQWFAMPNIGVFHGQDSQKILVVTLMYPADIEATDIDALRTIFDQVTNSIAPVV